MTSPAQQLLADRGIPLDRETAALEAGTTRIRFVGPPDQLAQKSNMGGSGHRTPTDDQEDR